MNCNGIERLIPLYVENDLDSRVTSKVEAHIRSCNSCSLIASEFRESQEWLTSLGSPSLDPESAARSRRAVLERVSEQDIEDGTRWFVKVSRRGLEAVAAGLVLAAILALILLSNHREGTRPELAANDSLNPAQQQATGGPAGTARPDVKPSAPERHRRRSIGNSTRVASLQQIARITDESDMPTIEEPTRRISLVSDDPRIDAEAETSMQRPIEQQASQQEMLRIEIHTSNPAVHIIWFAPKPAEPGE